MGCDAVNAAIEREEEEEEAQAPTEAVRIKREQHRLYADTMHSDFAAQSKESVDAAALAARALQMKSDAADPSGESDPF